MTVPSALTALSGTWTGTNRVWLDPEKAASESETHATVNVIAQGQFLSIQYTWADADQPQDGLLVIGQEAQTGLVKAYWLDSWHMSDKFMLCEGVIQSDGSARVKGSYSAPPGPDWGWQITIAPPANGTFRMTMHNITPEGEEMLAVEAVYKRQD